MDRGTNADGDEASRYGAGDDGNSRRYAVQLEPERTRTGGNGLNGAGCKGREEGDGEDDDRGRKSRRRVKCAQSARTANEEDEAEKSQELMNDRQRHVEKPARRAQAKPRDKNGHKEPADDTQSVLCHGKHLLPCRHDFQYGFMATRNYMCGLTILPEWEGPANSDTRQGIFCLRNSRVVNCRKCAGWQGDFVRILQVTVLIVIGVYLLVLAMFFFAQRSLLYYRTHTYIPLADAHANGAFREIAVRTPDGVDLKAWYAPATTKPLTIVFFHGNADRLVTAAQVADPYIDAGYGFLAAEYRGYSGLPGTPTEAGLYNDARAYLRELAAGGVASTHVILLGQSLGSGVAVQMATEFKVGGLILLSPYLSIPKVAMHHFPFFPAGLLILDRYENDRKIAGIHAPLLIVSGSRDDVVPGSQAKKLYALAHEPKEFRELTDRGHNDSLDAFVPVSLEWLGRRRPAEE